PGNQVGLISFGDHPTRHLPLQPYNSAMRGRLLAAVQQLEPEGSTAMVDGLAVAVADLMRARQQDPQGRFVVLLLSDGERTSGLTLPELQPVLAQSGITVIPIAYGEVNARELQELAAIREGSVYKGSPDQIVPLMSDLLQTTL
ncbi:MAG: vWA domain-containing protein, partial [Cyanobium sp.]